MAEGFDMDTLLAQAQQMQEQMLATRDNLAAREFETATDGDFIKVKLNGLDEPLNMTIASAAHDPEDTESLSALIAATFRSARQQVGSAAVSATPQVPGMGF